MEHEYAVLGGFNRANVGKWVMGASVGLAAAVSALAGLVVALVVDFGVEMPRLVLWPITAGSIYLLLYGLGIIFFCFFECVRFCYLVIRVIVSVSFSRTLARVIFFT